MIQKYPKGHESFKEELCFLVIALENRDYSTVRSFSPKTIIEAKHLRSELHEVYIRALRTNSDILNPEIIISYEKQLEISNAGTSSKIYIRNINSLRVANSLYISTLITTKGNSIYTFSEDIEGLHHVLSMNTTEVLFLKSLFKYVQHNIDNLKTIRFLNERDCVIQKCLGL